AGRGDREGGGPAEPLDDLHGAGVDERDAIPQNVAAGSAQQQRALADGEFRHRADPDQARLMLAIAVEMPAREHLERGPALPPGRNVLALVLADRTCRRRRVRGCELASAGVADESGHGTGRSAPRLGEM